MASGARSTIAYTAAATALAALLGWYWNGTREAVPDGSPFIRELERTERAGGDVLGLLFRGLKESGDAEAGRVVAWLGARQQRGDQPYLYLMGLYSAIRSDPAQRLRGVEYLARGALVYRIDAARCGDPTAAQAVQILEGAFGLPAIRERLRASPEIRQRIVAGALAWEARSAKRERPEWICAHGIGPGAPAPDAAALRAHRRTVRTRFERSF